MQTPWGNAWVVALVVAWALAIAWTDWRERRIPNLLSLGAWGVGVAVLALTGRSLLGAEPSSALLAAAGALLATLPGYLTRRLGAGDVKFLVATGLLSSWPLTLICFTVGTALGAAVGLVSQHRQQLYLCLPHWLQRQDAWLARWAVHTPPARHIPLGTCLSAGLITALFTAPAPL
jgi:prepilin peptidase CpaA